jgi:hypothetical protein
MRSTSTVFFVFFYSLHLTSNHQVEAADRRSSTMGFIWAGARALRRTHLGRFMKLRPDTAWLEGTLYEMDNPGQSGVCDIFFYLNLPVLFFLFYCQLPSA